MICKTTLVMLNETENVVCNAI